MMINFFRALTIADGGEKITKDSLHRGPSLSAGSSVGCHCGAKAFTVAPDLEEASGGMGDKIRKF